MEKNDDKNTQEESKKQEETKKEPSTEEEKKEDSKKKKKNNVVVPPKDFDFNNLESLWADSGKIDKNKKEMVYTPLIVKTGGNKLNNLDINLKLTETLPFSMTNFDKVNKGLANANINCYMNVTL